MSPVYTEGGLAPAPFGRQLLKRFRISRTLHRYLPRCFINLAQIISRQLDLSRAGAIGIRASLRLDAQRVGADRDLLVGLDDGALFAGKFAAGDQRGVAAFRCQPELALIVERQRGVHAADFRIAFQRQVHRY